MIVGLGKTGYSVAEYFLRSGVPFSIADDSANPPGMDALRALVPDLVLESVSAENLRAADEIVLSPGVPLKLPAIADAIAEGVPVTGDVQMFANVREKPLAVVTGSNGKSTVVNMLGELLASANVRAGVGGNIGTPCLDLLTSQLDCYVLEVSSYQLEVATSLGADVAVVLNLSPDHLDRYENEAEYYETKLKIYVDCEVALFNRATPSAYRPEQGARQVSFGLDAPDSKDDFGVMAQGGKLYLCKGQTPLIATDTLILQGRHNWLNALAALALGEALGFDLARLVAGLPNYKGLKHRCELVFENDGVKYINDSKSTNPGSTLAAINGLSQDKKNIWLLLGGNGKAADFSVLNAAIDQSIRQCFIYGRDQDAIAEQIHSPVVKKETLAEAITVIRELTSPGDIVLLSPGCASLDQFKSFEHRGEVFESLVKEACS